MMHLIYIAPMGKKRFTATLRNVPMKGDFILIKDNTYLVASICHNEEDKSTVTFVTEPASPDFFNVKS